MNRIGGSLVNQFRALSVKAPVQTPIRSLSVTPQNNVHLWMKKSGQRGRPYKLEHPRNAYFKLVLLMKSSYNSLTNKPFNCVPVDDKFGFSSLN